MMKKIEDLNYYELLEVSPTASSQDIHRAYERIRRVYEPNSVALYSLFSAEETTAIHQRIEEAYRTLVYEDNRKRYDALLRMQSDLPEPSAASSDYDHRQEQLALSVPLDERPLSVTAPPPPAFDEETVKPREEVAPVSQFTAEFTGTTIKMLRVQRGLSLRNIADISKVGIRYLELIEEENFQKLPVRAYTRGFLQLYAKALGCDPQKVCADYLKRFDAAREAKTK